MPSLDGFITKDLFDNPNVPLALDVGKLKARWHRVSIFLQPLKMNANGSLIDFPLLLNEDDSFIFFFLVYITFVFSLISVYPSILPNITG